MEGGGGGASGYPLFYDCSGHYLRYKHTEMKNFYLLTRVYIYLEKLVLVEIIVGLYQA